MTKKHPSGTTSTGEHNHHGSPVRPAAILSMTAFVAPQSAQPGRKPSTAHHPSTDATPLDVLAEPEPEPVVETSDPLPLVARREGFTESDRHKMGGVSILNKCSTWNAWSRVPTRRVTAMNVPDSIHHRMSRNH